MRCNPHRLPRPLQRKLEDLILKHKGEIINEVFPSIVEFAKFASNKLEYLIKPSNVKTACEAVDVKFAHMSIKLGKSNKAVMILTKELVKLYELTGETPSTELMSLIKE